ncbi:MAG: hypothetical protein ACI85U_004317 [Candidatus Promineifilaceae bacterium]
MIPLLKYCEEVQPHEAIIGWDKSQQPMVWSAADSTNHLLISGAPQSGKTGLLRSLILTLVMATRPAQLQLAIIDGSCQGGNSYDHSGLKKFSQLPHLLNRPAANPEEVCEIISFLTKEADHRLNNDIATPRILLILDNLQDILSVAGPEFHQQLEHILDIGPQTGIRVILATNRPEDGRLQDLISGLEIDRITGKLQSAGQATFASGRDDSEADHLDGNGEFLATLNADNFHFQAAWVTERQLGRYLDIINRPKQPPLVAWPIPNDDDYVNNVSDLRAEVQYGFLETTEFVSEEIDQDEYEDDDLENEEEFSNWPSAKSQISSVQPYNDNQTDLNAQKEPDEAQDNESAQQNRFTQLKNIYTKLSGFQSEDPAEDNQPLSNRHGFEIEEDHEWDEWDEIEAEDVVDEALTDELAKTDYKLDQVGFVFHEPSANYEIKTDGWLNDTSDSTETEPREEEEEEEEISDKTPQDDPFSFATNHIPKNGRRSRLSPAKPNPKFTDSPLKPSGSSHDLTESRLAGSNQTNGIKKADTFDPWQNGLDDEPDFDQPKNSKEPATPTPFTRPPSLTQRPTPTTRRRVTRSVSKFNPKPKTKPPLENLGKQLLDGETE